jgi:hypothetical protein
LLAAMLAMAIGLKRKPESLGEGWLSRTALAG